MSVISTVACSESDRITLTLSLEGIDGIVAAFVAEQMRQLRAVFAEETAKLRAALASAAQAPSNEAAFVGEPRKPRPPARSLVWSVERCELLRRDYPRNVPIRELWAAINALPGPDVTLKSVKLKANKLGLSRPKEGVMPKSRALPSDSPSQASAAHPVFNEPKREARPAAATVMLPASASPAPQVPFAAQPVLPCPRPKPGPVRVSAELARRWGAERGIISKSLEIDAINRRRDALGLPAFIVEPQARFSRDEPPMPARMVRA